MIESGMREDHIAMPPARQAKDLSQGRLAGPTNAALQQGIEAAGWSLFGGFGLSSPAIVTRQWLRDTAEAAYIDGYNLMA